MAAYNAKDQIRRQNTLGTLESNEVDGGDGRLSSSAPPAFPGGEAITEKGAIWPPVYAGVTL
jgi:hypothetical protein